MRIVLDGRPTQPGYRAHLGRGIGHYAEKVIEHLSDLDSEDTFLILRDRTRDFNLRSDRQHLRDLSYSAAGWIPTRYEMLRNQIVLPWVLPSAKADLVHFFCHEDAPLLFGGKMILTLHDTIPLALPDLYRPRRNWLYRCKHEVMKRIARRAHRIVADSENTKRDIIRFYSVPGQKIEVIYPGVDKVFKPVGDPCLLESVKDKYGVGGDFIFYLGGIDARKNIKNLLEAFRKILNRGFSDLRLVIGGEIKTQPEYPDLIDQIKRFQLGDTVRLTGYISAEDLVLLYSAASLFLFPSLYEGFGLPALEAMACGAPLITCCNSSLVEVVGDAAIFADPHKPEDIAEKIQLLLSRPELRKSLREKGIKRAKLFCWEKTAQKILRVYHEFEKEH